MQRMRECLTAQAVCIVLCIALVAMLATRQACAAPFTAGGVVVSVSGPNTEPTGAADIAPLSLIEYTAAGVATGTVVALPTADAAVGSDTNYAIVGSQSASSLYGSLRRSVDGRFLTISASNVPATTTADLLPGGVFSSTNFQNRTIARIDVDGVVDTTTRFLARGTTPRGAVSTDGTSIWWAANSGTADSGGVRFVTLGDTTAGPLLTDTGTSSISRSNTNGIGIFDGQLYLAYNVSPFRGVYSLGTGLQQSGGPLPATEVVAATSVTDFFFADPDTLYVAVSSTDPALSGLGLQKWSYSSQSQTWTNQWTANPAGMLGVRALAGTVSGETVDLYAVTLADTAASTPNSLLRLADTLSGTTFPAGGFATLATSTPGSLFRGVALAPVPEPTALLSAAGLAWLTLLRRGGPSRRSDRRGRAGLGRRVRGS